MRRGKKEGRGLILTSFSFYCTCSFPSSLLPIFLNSGAFSISSSLRLPGCLRATLHLSLLIIIVFFFSLCLILHVFLAFLLPSWLHSSPSSFLLSLFPLSSLLSGRVFSPNCIFTGLNHVIQYNPAHHTAP